MDMGLTVGRPYMNSSGLSRSIAINTFLDHSSRGSGKQLVYAESIQKIFNRGEDDESGFECSTSLFAMGFVG